MNDQEIVAVLDKRISKGVRALGEIMTRKGGPGWVAAQDMMKAELRFVIQHLTGQFEMDGKMEHAKEPGSEIPCPPPMHTMPVGWFCPQCGGIVSPNTSMCPRCSDSQTFQVRPSLPVPGIPNVQ